MTEIPIAVRTHYREEKDGTHTLTFEMSGIPSRKMAQGISDWVRELVRNHAKEIGRFEDGPGVQ
jgi:hypothetical protein